MRRLLMRRLLLSFGLLVVTLCARQAEATLIDRGNGLIYDTVLNITWTQNANLCVTLGNCIPGPGGFMSFANANTWAANLVFGGFSDWRLANISSTSPTTTPTDCSTATAAACAASGNELGYMFYQNLNGTFDDSKVGNQVGNGGVTFNNIQVGYWSGTEGNAVLAWSFLFFDGNQGNVFKVNFNAAWAVRPGDSVGVPEPG